MTVSFKVAFFALVVLVFTIPTLSVFSGLALAPALVALGLASSVILLAGWRSMALHYTVLVLLCALIIWAGVSALWSISPKDSLVMWARLCALFIFGVVTVWAFFSLGEEKKGRVVHVSLFAVMFMISVFHVEILTQGLLSKAFHAWVQPDKPYHFDLSDLNRGACVLALLVWPLLAMVNQVRCVPMRLRALLVAALWGIVGVTLLNLESLSAILAYGVASVIFSLIYLSKGRAVVLLTIGTLLCVPLCVVALWMEEPTALAERGIDIPKSALHRLYIWDFVTDRIAESPWLGYGLNMSRNVPGAADTVTEMGEVLFPEWQNIPAHPHNSLIQVWLELGIMGLMIFTFLMASVFKAIDVSSVSPGNKAIFSAVAVSYIVMGLTAYSMWQNWWVAAGFLAAAIPILLLEGDGESNKS